MSRKHIHDEIRARYKLTPEEHLSAGSPSLEVEPQGQQITREAQGDHAEAERQSAAVVDVVVDRDVHNDVDMQNAAANVAELQDSGDRRVKLADTLMDRMRDTPLDREAVSSSTRDGP